MASLLAEVSDGEKRPLLEGKVMARVTEDEILYNKKETLGLHTLHSVPI